MVEGFSVRWHKQWWIATDLESAASATGNSPSEACENLAILLGAEFELEGIISPCKAPWSYTKILRKIRAGVKSKL